MEKLSIKFKQSIVFVFVICFSSLYAQQTTAYDNFDPSKIKETQKYTWNFNPLEYDPEILVDCITDIINLARHQYNCADSLQKNDILSNAAGIQAEFMAKEEERTLDNVVANLKTSGLRSASVGGSKRVTELVTRVKATKGIEDYSYYDVAVETVNSLLKNKKSSPTLLDKRYTVIGVASGVDNFNKYCYVSLVFGNDLSFNRGEIGYKKTTYSRKLYGLQPYEEKACRKCEVRNVELFQKYIEVKGDDIYFNHPNVKEVKKLIGKDNDGIAVDIVQHSQFPCNSSANDVDYNYPNRGVMLKYMKFPKMVKKNENKDSKDKSMRVYLGTVPSTVSLPYDVNVLLIKDKKICKTVVKTTVRTANIDYKAKTSLIPDLTSITTTMNYVPKPEKTLLEFNVPFELAKAEYQANDIKPFVEALKEPKFIVDSVQIVAYTSIDGSEKKNMDLQKERSESIVKAMEQMQSSKIPYRIETNDGWELFTRDVPTTHQHLAKGSKAEAKSALQNKKTKKELEPMLAKHRFANIKMQATYDVSEKYEQEFVCNKFNRVLAAGDLATAFAIQKYIIKQVEDGKYRRRYIETLEIPETVAMIPFLTNKYYMLSFFDGITSKLGEKVETLAKMDSKNLICEFNALCCSISEIEFSNAGQTTSWQSKVDKFYNTNIGKQYSNKVDAVNIALQYQILDFINTNENPDEALKETTYEKIKTIALPTLTDWKKAYEVASSFISYGDYDFARSALDAYIEDPKVSEDYIFTYLNLYSLDENAYMSKKFDTACKLAAAKNKSRFCNEIKDYSFLIRENVGVKNTICSQCR